MNPENPPAALMPPLDAPADPGNTLASVMPWRCHAMADRRLDIAVDDPSTLEKLTLMPTSCDCAPIAATLRKQPQLSGRAHASTLDP
jgi:hypothetical protein